MALTKNDEAVSPVIGVILMVAVTVILAAVIASFVFGMSGNVQKTKVVAATALMTTDGGIDVTYQGGPDTDSLTAINITAPNGSVWYTTDSMGTLSTSGSSSAPPRVGAVMKLIPISPISDWPPGQKHIVVVGTFNDGSSHVILDTMVKSYPFFYAPPISPALPNQNPAYAIPEPGTGNTCITTPGCPWLSGVLPEPVGDLTGALLHGRDT